MAGDLFTGRRQRAAPARPGLRGSPTARCDDRQDAPWPPGARAGPPYLPPTQRAPDGLIRYVRLRPLKRAIDLLLLIPAALVALPLIGLGVLAVWIVDPGPPFYGQERIGFEGRAFILWKLRTMRRDADATLNAYLATHDDDRSEWEAHFKLTHDPRVLPIVGPFLRHFSLDELPQLWNVARGQMSFVGPRPFPAYHLAALPGDVCHLRSSVLPGLTGLWQITGRSDGDLAAQCQADVRYVREWTPGLDLRILARTPAAVLRGTGAV